MLTKPFWGEGNEPQSGEPVAYVSASCPAPSERESSRDGSGSQMKD